MGKASGGGARNLHTLHKLHKYPSFGYFQGNYGDLIFFNMDASVLGIFKALVGVSQGFRISFLKGFLFALYGFVELQDGFLSV